MVYWLARCRKGQGFGHGLLARTSVKEEEENYCLSVSSSFHRFMIFLLPMRILERWVANYSGAGDAAWEYIVPLSPFYLSAKSPWMGFNFKVHLFISLPPASGAN